MLVPAAFTSQIWHRWNCCFCWPTAAVSSLVSKQLKHFLKIFFQIISKYLSNEQQVRSWGCSGAVFEAALPLQGAFLPRDPGCCALKSTSHSTAGLGRGEKPGMMEDNWSFSWRSNTASLLLLVKHLKTHSVPPLLTTGIQKDSQPFEVPHVQPHGSISAERGHSTQSRLVTMAEL